MDEDLSLNSAASFLHVSYGYLSQLFSKEIGENFNKYVTRIRIEESKNLIMCKNLKMDEVAEKVGFNNASYFIKVFKKHTGTTPYEYRNINTKVISS